MLSCAAPHFSFFISKITIHFRGSHFLCHKHTPNSSPCERSKRNFIDAFLLHIRLMLQTNQITSSTEFLETHKHKPFLLQKWQSFCVDCCAKNQSSNDLFDDAVMCVRRSRTSLNRVITA